MVILNVWTKGYLRVFCSILGMAVGYAASAALGLLHPSAAVPAGGLALLRLPRFDVMDWHFNAEMLVPFAMVAVAGTLHLMGNISTSQRINDADWVRPNFGSIDRRDSRATGLLHDLRAVRQHGRQQLRLERRPVHRDRHHQPQPRLCYRHHLCRVSPAAAGGRLVATIPPPVSVPRCSSPPPSSSPTGCR